MSFFIATIFATFSFVLYLGGQGEAFTSVCRHTLDLCQYPGLPLWIAGAFVAFGLLFRIQQT